jgi:hypothetical protein
MTIESRGPATPQAPLRIFIDLSGHGDGYRRELERLIEGLGRAKTPDAILVDSASAADCRLRIEGCPQLNGDVLACLKRHEPKSPREFVWDSGDLPSGSLPGFYVSLPSYMYDRKRHRAFCMPIQCNEAIRAYDLSEAKFLYGFFGAISSGLRGRMAAALRAQNERQEGLIEIRDSIWHQMFDRSGLSAKADYADAVRRCRFNLCPRGAVLAGAGSRLYETMQAARVPVIISDWITLPEGVDWDACAVRVRERDIPLIPHILRDHAERWPLMAANARRAWETHFSEEALLGEMGRQLRVLLESDQELSIAGRIGGARRVALGLLSFKSRQYYGRAQRFRALWRGLRSAPQAGAGQTRSGGRNRAGESKPQ